jgi:hypothetical protein
MAQPAFNSFSLLASLAFLPSFLIANILIANPPAVSALQQQLGVAVEGYITAVNAPTGFDVNGQHVVTQPETTYGLDGDRETSIDSPLRNAVRVGAFVSVTGRTRGKIVVAQALRFREDWDRELTGLGVIDKVISNGAEPVLQADGYRIRIIASTRIAFKGAVKTLADVGTNTWLHYEGRRTREGYLLASKAEFIGAKPAKFKALRGFEVSSARVKSAGPNRKPGPYSLPADDAGALQANDKVKLTAFSLWHTILDDPVLQERVRRVGMKLVPEFQRNMADDHPSKIHFYFYAVDDEKDRSALCALDGLILVPKAITDRIRNDDQLAAVLASCVAYNLQRQAARVVADNRVLLGLYEAGVVAGDFVPGLNVVTLIGTQASIKIETELEEQRDRVALSLMADAGYDPWQAPERGACWLPKNCPQIWIR